MKAYSHTFKETRSKLIINSSIAFVIATIIEMTLHESGHFFTSVIMGRPARLHHNYVEYLADAALHVRVLAAAAGPILSLLVGITFHYILNKKVNRGMRALVMIYLSVFGYIGFFGYLLIAPFFKYGDTGFVLNALSCPTWLTICFSFAAAWCAFIITRSFSVHFIAIMSAKRAENLELRKEFIINLVFVPLFLGIAATTLLNLPVPSVLSLIAPLTSPFMLLWPFGYYLNSRGTYYDSEETVARYINLKWVAVLMAAILINRFLVNGVEM